MAKKKKQAAPPAPPTPEAPLTAMGRPTSYLPEYTRQAEQLCQLGATDAEMADFFDVTVRTINRWKVTHPEFSVAIRRGKASADNRVEDSLYHRAMGTEYEKAHPVKLKKVIYDNEGRKVAEEERVEVVMVKEIIPPDTTAMIFWLKNRRKEAWRDMQQHEHGKPGEFDAMDDAALDAAILEQTQALAELDPEFAAKLKKMQRTTRH